ncbi:MAG: hypothetical protein H6559_37970 [Lewinellaceae bacterium]|nr:hypothetical protein [Lewinellaceae bacterium]
MAFKDEAQKLNSKDRERLEDLLKRWQNKNNNAVKALIADQFLPLPEMKYLARRLVEISEGPKKDKVEEELNLPSFSWMQLKGGRVSPGSVPGRVGTFIPFVRLHNHLVTHYRSFFPGGAGIGNFIDELEQARHPGRLLTERGKGYENIRIQPDFALLRFYWSPDEHPVPLEQLLSTLARERGKYLGQRYKKSVLLIFDAISFSHEMYSGTGMGLHRPAWPDGMTKEDFELLPDVQGRFGLARVESGAGGMRAAEAICRSAYLPLSELAFCKVQY